MSVDVLIYKNGNRIDDDLEGIQNYHSFTWYMKYIVLPSIYKDNASISTYEVAFNTIYKYRFKIARYIANYYSGIASNWVYNPEELDKWRLKAIFNADNKFTINSIISYFTDYFTVLVKLYKFNKKYGNDKLKIVIC